MAKQINIFFKSVTFAAGEGSVEITGFSVADIICEIGEDVVLDAIGEEECIKHFAIQVADEYK